jgi:hypothetical protein
MKTPRSSKANCSQPFRPCPKPRRIEDRKTIDWVLHKRDGCCMYGLHTHRTRACSGPLDPHHIQTRGAGGDDVPENLITLCRTHHNLAQNHRIPKEELYGILRDRYGYQYG